MIDSRSVRANVSLSGVFASIGIEHFALSIA